MKKPLVVIIILNWNGKKWLKKCLSSLYNLTDYSNYKILLVDNASTDGSIEFVKKHYTQTDILSLDKNYGFAKGNNLGIKYALRKYKPDYILILNNDIKIVQKSWLSKCISFCESHKNIVISVSQTDSEMKKLKPEAINVLSYGVILENFDLTKVFLGGWFLLFPSSIIKFIIKRLEGEFFPEDFFVYMEDSFIFWLLKILGVKTYLLDDVSLIHYGGRSRGGKGNPFALKFCQRNSLYNLYIFYSARNFLALLPLYAFFSFFNLSYRIFIQRSPKRALSIVLGILDGFKGLFSRKIRKYKRLIRKIYKEFEVSDKIIIKSSSSSLFSDEITFSKFFNKISDNYIKFFVKKI